MSSQKPPQLGIPVCLGLWGGVPPNGTNSEAMAEAAWITAETLALRLRSSHRLGLAFPQRRTTQLLRALSSPQTAPSLPPGIFAFQ